MNYIYDILLNFQEKLYDFYDWNMGDDIKHIRRIPLFKISSDDLISFKENKFVVDKSLLNKIYNKGETFENRKIAKLDYACLFCDGFETIGICFAENGESILKTKLLIDEDSEVLDVCSHLDEETINYNIIGEDKPNYLQTREEMHKKEYIIKELEKLFYISDTTKIKYLYYDCFNKNESSMDTMLENFNNAIKNDFSTIGTKIYDFLKLTSLKK